MCDEPFEEEYEEECFLEYGSGYFSPTGAVELKSYFCPRCGKRLFDADIDLHGVIYIRCKRCRRKVWIETKPRALRIGFV